MISKILVAAAASLLAVSAANAQACKKNFSVVGVPSVTAVSYKSFGVLKLDAKKALDNAHRVMLAEGFENIKVDKAMGSLTAKQETSGSGREQTLRVVLRKSGKGSRIDVVFMVQAGQIAPEDATRDAICRVIEGAAG
ncbi:hypothetical protein ACHMW4_21420 [Mesorhizobium sp. UC22_110]|jgi:hypothetical protein|uniref:hypothetical protein n=1 Tax=unclassified Mesorhizobium TaxID=325217 RepID=UPI00366E0780